MKAHEWRQALGECVRDFFRTPEMEHFYSIKMTRERARIYLLQLGLYALQRRNNWPQVAANCPEFDVKRRILSHEYQELFEDEHSKAGHMDLIFRQGKEVGLSVDDVINAEPLPTPGRQCTRGSGSRARARGRKPSRRRRSRSGPMTIGCWAIPAEEIAAGSTRFGRGI